MAAVPNSQDVVGEAMGLIDGAGLPHPMVQIVASFVLEALNPQVAANYVIGKCREAGDQPHEPSKSWSRTGNTSSTLVSLLRRLSSASISPA